MITSSRWPWVPERGCKLQKCTVPDEKRGTIGVKVLCLILDEGVKPMNASARRPVVLIVEDEFFAPYGRRAYN
jgi:hypothetical protein